MLKVSVLGISVVPYFSRQNCELVFCVCVFLGNSLKHSWKCKDKFPSRVLLIYIFSIDNKVNLLVFLSFFFIVKKIDSYNNKEG